MQTNIYMIDYNINSINKDVLLKINNFKIYKIDYKEYINKNNDKDFINDINLYNNILIDISNLYKFKDSKINISSIKHIKSFNFDVVDSFIYNTCSTLLDNGFYPYMDMSLSIVFIKTLKRKSDILKEVSDLVEKDMKKLKGKMINVFSYNKSIVNNIYKMYYKKEYRACILLVINLLNILYNDIYKYTGLDDNKNKLINLAIQNDNNKNFIELSPYLLDNNYILNNTSNYNIFDISNGKNDRYATKINALRYISVLLNTMNLFEFYV